MPTSKHLLSLVFLILLAPLLPAQTAARATGRFKLFTPPQKGGEIRWSVAEKGRVEMQRDDYAILEGDVKIEYQDIKLQADKVTYNARTKDVVAEGHVIIDQGPTRLTATQAIYNLDSKTGTFFNATGTMEPSMYFSGDRIEKVDADTYKLSNGVFTSCDLDRPAWSFHVANAEVTMDDYAHMRNLSIRAKDVPVFWTPVLVWPTKRERSRGFLIPRAVLHKTFGNGIALGYFVPFGESADATIYADVNTKGYNGLGTSIRYLPSENVKIGEFNAHTVRDVETKKQQWKFQYQHSQDNLPGGFRGVVDIQDYSDLEFFQRWDSNSRLQTLSNIYSSAYLTKNRPNYSLNVLADRRDIVLGRSDFTPNAPILSQRFEQLPSLQLRMFPQRVGGTPVYFALESSASRLRTSGLLATAEADYYRGDIFPTISLQLRTPAWLSIKPQISLRQTYYSASLLSSSTTGRSEAVDESLTRSYAQGQVEIVGPQVSRIFNRSMGGFTRFKHVIEPRFRYLYTTSVGDQNRVIRFDTVDSPFLPLVRDSVEYSLTQRVIGKAGGADASPREILSFSLRQSMSLSQATTDRTTTGGTPDLSKQPRFTPLTASLHVNPYQSITLDAMATFGNISHQIDQALLSANLVGTGEHADKYLGFSWFASFLQPQQTTGDSSQIRLNSGTNIWKDRLRTDVQFNFDVKRRHFLEQRILLGGTASCWGLTIEYRRYLVFTPTETALWNLSGAITLKNIGTIGAR